MAEVCSLAGQTGEALANVASAFAYQNKNHEIWSASELHRINGDVLVKTGALLQAQVSYEHAIASGRQIGARSLELRAQDRLREVIALQNPADPSNTKSNAKTASEH